MTADTKTHPPATTGVRHATIVLERRLKASSARAFRAWADGAERARWDVPGKDWEVAEHRQDFRVGGEEQTRFGPKGAANIMSKGRYLDIVQDCRIITAGVMHADEIAMTATLCTVTFAPDGAGTKLTLTDQSCFFGWETEEMRRGGFNEILDKLQVWLEQN
jgi:uncharacterized protein YndB with AHSA1/START domain